MLQNAKWIRCGVDTNGVLPVFIKKKRFEKRVVKATAYLSAMGVYDFFINGKKVGDCLFAPGYTTIYKFAQYQVYDITELLTETTEFSIEIARCWVSTADSQVLACIGAFTFLYDDGSEERLVTDESWDVYTSRILFSSWYHGETLDLTAPVRFLDKATVYNLNISLMPQVGEYVKEQERVAAKRFFITPKGEKVIDFGQNLAGYVEICYRGKYGDKIRLSHAEVLDKDGNFYTENYRTAKNEIVYVLDGQREIFKPSHTYQGYRYIRLDEFPIDTIDLSAFTSVAVYSDMKRTGYFVSGHEKLNKLCENILWGQRSNFVDFPTDCPQRDERYGWTGDAQFFCRTACINYDTEKFYKKWLASLVVEQDEDGKFPFIIPNRNWGVVTGAAAWGDACTIVPWEVYLAYGDTEILEFCYPTMVRWIEYIRSVGEEELLWCNGEQFGDWLALDAEGGGYMGATQTDFIATAFYAYSISLLIKAGKAIGKDVSKYEMLYQNVKKAFRTAFMKDGMPILYPKGDCKERLKEERFQRDLKAVTQTSLAILLKFDLCLPSERQKIAATLADLVRKNGNRLTTGFVGTPYLLHALSENGYTDVAYDLLLQEKNPSWLFSVNQGATTIWEHWDGVKEDGSFWSPEMNSFNHYAYGAVYDWIFGVAAGIKVCEDGAGYKKIIIAPNPEKRIGFMDVRYETRSGFLKSAWRYVDGGVKYSFIIPQKTVAEIRLKNGETHTVQSGEYTFLVKE